MSKKYTKEDILKIRKNVMANLDDALDVLADLENTEKERKSGKSDIISHKVYYEEECITDYKEKPYQLFLFVRHFWLKQTPKGRLTLTRKREVVEFLGRTHKELDEKVDNYVTQSDGECPPEVIDDSKWFPPDLIQKKKALSLLEK